jgi:hypothetical protein
MRHWLSEDTEIKRLLDSLDKIQREDICKKG